MTGNHYQLLLAGCHQNLLSAARHSHNGIELVWVDRGHCSVEFEENGIIEADPGDLYITPPRLLHSQRNTPDCITRYAVMMVDEPECDYSLRLLKTGGDSMLRSWFAQLPELYENGSLQTASRLLAVIWSRLKELERQQHDLMPHPVLERAINYLSIHITKPCIITELAARVGVSTGHLNLLFRRQFGKGPLRYLNELRLNRARQLLGNPYWSIAEVAERAGFSDPNYFSRKFHAFFHETPQACRRRLLEADWVDFPE